MAAILSPPQKINRTRKATPIPVPEPLELRFGNPEFKSETDSTIFLEANPNPERQGCPDEKTLRDDRRESACPQITRHGYTWRLAHHALRNSGASRYRSRMRARHGAEFSRGLLLPVC